jgi:hypothetical protein
VGRTVQCRVARFSLRSVRLVAQSPAPGRLTKLPATLACHSVLAADRSTAGFRGMSGRLPHEEVRHLHAFEDPFLEGIGGCRGPTATYTWPITKVDESPTANARESGSV